MTELPGLARTLWFTLRIAFRSHPALAMGTLLLVPAGWLSGTLGAWWLKVFVNGATSGDAAAVAIAAALLVGTQILGWAAAGLGGRMLQTFQDRAGVALEQRLIEVSAGMAAIEHLERPDTWTGSTRCAGRRGSCTGRWRRWRRRWERWPRPR